MGKREYVLNQMEKQFGINSIVSMFYSDLGSQFCSSGESHDFWELVFVDRGSIWVLGDDDEFELNRGEMFLHPPNQFHIHRAPKNKDCSICIISFHLVDGDVVQTLTKKKIKISTSLISILSRIMHYGSLVFQKIIDTDEKLFLVKSEEYNKIYEHLIVNYLEIFFLEALNEQSQNQETLLNNLEFKDIQSSYTKILVTQVEQYLSKMLYSKISISELCRFFNCSKTTLSVAFKTYTGKSIIQYFNAIKIEKAKELIREQRLNFTEISNTLNYCNQNYFSNLFKKQTGYYPSEYAKSIKIYQRTHMLHKDVGIKNSQHLFFNEVPAKSIE